MNIQLDLYVLLPELILAIGAMALLLIGAVRGDRSAGTLTILSVILIAVSAMCRWFCPTAPRSTAPS